MPVWSKSDICDLLDIRNCPGVTRQGRRTSLPSLPSPTTSTILNPATVSFDRGLGIEVIQQAGNPAVFSLASGSGKLGGALISSSLENTFFGNRVFELDDNFLKRNEEKKQYKTSKMNLALGAKLLRKKYMALDLGVILKRHSEIKRINPGMGLSGKIGPLNFGAAYYQDDFFLNLEGHNDPLTGIPYSIIFGSSDYSEKFTVTTYSIGTKFQGLALDAGVIKTNYERDEMDTEIHLYSGSYTFKNFMFNLAYRNEISPATKFIDGQLDYRKSTGAIFTGLQMSLNRFAIIGINYNYFLLEEYSLIGSFFF